VLDGDGRRVEAEIRTAGGTATYVHLDVTSEDDWRAAVALAETTYGRLNVLVNNAGIVIRKSIEETTDDDLDRILAVNLKGVFWGTKHAIPAMRRTGGGSIINISSTAGLVGSPYGSAAYTATKGACVWLPRRPPCSMPPTTSGATLSLPVRFGRPCCRSPRPPPPP